MLKKNKHSSNTLRIQTLDSFPKSIQGPYSQYEDEGTNMFIMNTELWFLSYKKP